MPACDLCSHRRAVGATSLGSHAERRVWLCASCQARRESHDLTPRELLALARKSAAREGKCEWCAAAPVAAQVRVRTPEGGPLNASLCATCALRAHQQGDASVIAPEAARAGKQQQNVDPRYERALAVARRRRQMRLVKSPSGPIGPR